MAPVSSALSAVGSCRSKCRDGGKRSAQRIGRETIELAFDRRVGFPPNGNGGSKHLFSHLGKGEQPGTAVSRRRRDPHQPAPFEWLEGRSQRRAVHRQELGDRSHWGWLGSVQ